MSRELRVNADELRIAADQLDMYAVDLRHDHAAAHANMASAVPGFGSALSAAALNERIVQWEQETDEHHAELARYGERHRMAGFSYDSTDSDSSERIIASGGGVDEAAVGLDR
jgi:ferritin-like metal-binding protein YciE